MASFLRVAARQGCRLLASRSVGNPKFIQPISFISTSKTKTDASSLTTESVSKLQTPHESLADREENWISYGYSLVDRDQDELIHMLIMFMGVTMCMCWGSFILAYQPDNRIRDWSQREAYLELSRREKEGLPLIEGNLIPPEEVLLPSDEELGEFEIIV